VTVLAAALPDNGGYVAAAYLVFFAIVVIYLAIMATKLARLEREVVELNELADRPQPAPAQASPAAAPDQAEVAR
jgi:hypothetical protein